MHRSFLIFAMAFVALLAGALFYAARIPVQQAAPAAEQAANEVPDPQFISFTMKDLDGKDRQFSEWQGRPRMLNFWATWCAPCRREIPLLKAFQDEQAGDGILIMGIAVDFVEEVSAYAEQAAFNYPILVGQDDAMAVAESSGINFVAMPFTMFVARNGEYLGAYLGELHREHLDRIAGIFGNLDDGIIDNAMAAEALALL
ncbi:MAG: TlpA family protein disulfide reductase [Woeseiaceae bacterium]|nr:TlpA family protein disulfide reductase [Woeseiaceae bacterium]